MYEEQSAESPLLGEPFESDALVGEQYKGRILVRDGLSVLIDPQHASPSDNDLELLVKRNSNLELIGEDKQIISPILLIYNGQTSDRGEPFATHVIYRLFTLRNVNNLDESNLTRLLLLKDSVDELSNREAVAGGSGSLSSSINDRLYEAGEEDDEMEAALDADSLNRFWSELEVDDLCDTQRSSHRPLLMCFICKSSFTVPRQLARHADQTHDAQLTGAEKYLLFSSNRRQSAILQSSSCGGRPLLTFLASQPSSNSQSNPTSQADNEMETEAIEPNSPVQTNLQVATNNFLNSLLNDNSQKEDLESQPKSLMDQKDDLESSPFGNLEDLANLESIAKAAAALQKSTSISLDLAPGSPDNVNSCSAASNAANSAAQSLLSSANNFFANNQALFNSLTGNGGNPSSVASLVNLLPQLTAQQQQQLQLLASVNGSAGSTGTSNALLNSSQAANLNSSNPNLPNSLVAQPANGNQSTQSNGSQSVAGLGQHHMAMLHSRNSCKTLKCPKCNWHYKYQETLEIHMKEKHPETELNCVYCLANQPHPRLARGETYTCGYKPYRCDVCNYSTTTKGNLSIHMQSDKHINNVQELQSGNLPPEMLQSLVQQQQQLNSAQLAVSTASDQPPTSGNQPNAPSTSGVLFPSTCSSSTTSLSTNPNASLTSTTSSGQLTNCSATVTSSSLSSLSSSSLNSLNSNNQLTNASNPSSSLSANPQSSNGQTMSGQMSSNQPANSGAAPLNGSKPLWRCDICKYDTNLPRNLRIHMTSEKHTNNMLLVQQNVKQMQQLSALQGAASLDSSAQAMLQQLNPNLLAALAAANNGQAGNQLQQAANQSADQMSAEQLADLTYNQALLLMSGQQANPQMGNQLKAPANNQQPTVTPKQLPNELLQLLPSDKQAIVDLEHPDPSLRMDYVDYDEHHCRVFQCMVCAVFTCDTVEQLAAHVQVDRSKLRENEVLSASNGQFHCDICDYNTSLKANFQLHCQTEKHTERLKKVNHIKEGGQSNKWKLKYVIVSNSTQLRCNLCDYYTNSLHKLQLHVSNARHEASTRVFLHLKVGDQLLRASDNEIQRTAFCCEPCSLSHPTIFALLHHLNSARHVQSENFRQIKLQMEISQGKLTMKTLDEEIRELFTVKPDFERHEGECTLFASFFLRYACSYSFSFKLELWNFVSSLV